jgi:hypothetical protein
MPRRHELHPPPVEADGAAEVRVVHRVDAQLGQLVGDLDEREHRSARALGDLDRVAVVVGVAVREQDVRRLQFVRGHGRLRVAGDERVHEDPRVAVDELDRRLREEADVHVVSPPVP